MTVASETSQRSAWEASVPHAALVDVKIEDRPAVGPVTRPSHCRFPIAVVLIGIPVLVIGLFYLQPYLSGDWNYPIGADTAKYMWRADLVSQEGLGGLDALAYPFDPNVDRPAYPAMSSAIHAATGLDAFRLAFVLPAVLSIAVGLAAGVFAIRCLREPLWAFPLFAVVVGVSINVSQTARGRLDNLMVDVLVMAVAALLVSIATGRGGFAAALILLAGSSLFHWSLTGLFVALIVAFALVLLPGSIRAWRSHGGPPWATASGRLLGLAGASGAVAGGALLLADSLPYRVPANKLQTLVTKLFAKLAPPNLPSIVAGLGVAGATLLAPPREREKRWGLLFASIWAGMFVVAFAIDRIFTLEQPTYRFLGFALGIPLLLAAGLSGAYRLMTSRRNHRARWRAVALVAAVLVVTTTISGLWWRSNRPKITMPELRQITAAGNYLQRVPESTPIIFVFRLGLAIGVDHVVRAYLPDDLISRIQVYQGPSRDLLRGEPFYRGTGTAHDVQARQAWASVEPILDEQPVIVEMQAFTRGLSRSIPGAWSLTPRVLIVRGPKIGGPASEPPTSTPSPGALLLMGAILLALLSAVGAGWSAALVRGSGLVQAGLSPALGVAILALFTVGAEAVGIGARGIVGIAVVAAAAAAGWLIPTVRSRLARRPVRRADELVPALPAATRVRLSRPVRPMLPTRPATGEILRATVDGVSVKYRPAASNGSRNGDRRNGRRDLVAAGSGGNRTRRDPKPRGTA